MEPSDRWKLAWALGGLVVAVAAGLLLTIISLARRITGQAREIEEAIHAARRHTAPLFDLSSVNAKLHRIAHELGTTRERA